MNSIKVTFRNAALADISNIMKVEHASFSPVICEEEIVFAERIRTFPDGFRVMEYDDKIIGYICSELWEKTEHISKELFTLGHSIQKQHKSHGKEIYISSMGLIPEYRNLGLGRTMFEEFIKYIANKLDIESVILVVSEKWSKARRIYKTNGFQEIDILNGFFQYDIDKPHSENGIIMRKHLLQ